MTDDGHATGFLLSFLTHIMHNGGVAMTRLLFFVAIAVTLAFVTMPISAQQWDAKHYHGSMCQPENDEDDLYRWYTKGTKNKGEFLADLICPIVRDNTTNTDGVLVRVTVQSSKDKPGGWCSLHALSWPNASTVLSAWGVWGDPGIQVVELRLDRSFRHGHYALWCTLRLDSQVISYWVAEHLPTASDN